MYCRVGLDGTADNLINIAARKPHHLRNGLSPVSDPRDPSRPVYSNGVGTSAISPIHQSRCRSRAACPNLPAQAVAFVARTPI
jgi:hypothetical protein